MTHHRHHKVKSHRWEDGMLKTFEHEFDTWEEALEFANNSNEPTVKIYHSSGELLLSILNAGVDLSPTHVY
jgi:hypothetical protein